MTRTILLARRIAVVAAGISMAACTSLSGLGGSAEYGCKAPPGVQCDSVSGNYYNALRNNLPSQRLHRQPATADSAAAPARQPAAMQSSSTPAGALTAMPLRSQARVLRLWVKPWEDTDHDLVDQGFVYVQVDNGRWLIDHVQQRIRSAYVPIRPPHAAAQPADATANLAEPRRPDASASGAASFAGTASPRPGSVNPATGDSQ